MNDFGQPLPRGRHGIDRDEIRRNQRSRLIEATIETVADQGYAQTTVGHIVARARVSRETFYEMFSDKEDCYTASLLDSVGDVIGAFEAAIGDDSRPAAERLEAGLTAYLQSLAARPAVATCFILEQPSTRKRSDAEERIPEESLQMLRDAFGLQDRFAVRAYLAMLNGIVVDEVHAGRTEQLPELIPQLMPVVRRVLEI